eukprot:1138237-Pelagomonas_calceolata.AAC.5
MNGVVFGEVSPGVVALEEVRDDGVVRGEVSVGGVAQLSTGGVVHREVRDDSAVHGERGEHQWHGAWRGGGGGVI